MADLVNLSERVERLQLAARVFALSKFSQPRVPAGSTHGGEFASSRSGGGIRIQPDMGGIEGTGSRKKGGEPIDVVADPFTMSPALVEYKKDVIASLNSIPEQMRVVPAATIRLSERSMAEFGATATTGGVFITDSYSSRLGRIEVTIKKGGETLRNKNAVAKTAAHEYAHAADRYLGSRGTWRSDGQDFRSKFDFERRQIPKSANTYCRDFWGTPRREAFAELYAVVAKKQYPERGAVLRQYYPQTLAVVREIFKMEGD